MRSEDEKLGISNETAKCMLDNLARQAGFESCTITIIDNGNYALNVKSSIQIMPLTSTDLKRICISVDEPEDEFMKHCYISFLDMILDKLSHATKIVCGIANVLDYGLFASSYEELKIEIDLNSSF